MQITKYALISVDSAYSTKAEPKKAAFLLLSVSVGAGLALVGLSVCWAFGETGRKAAFYCRFLFVPSLLSSLSLLSVSVSAHGLQCRASGSLALARSLRLWWGLVSAGRSCLRCCRRAGSGSSGVSLLGLISGAALPLVLSPCPFVRVSLLGLALRPLRCCLSVSRRSRVQCYGFAGAWLGR